MRDASGRADGGGEAGGNAAGEGLRAEDRDHRPRIFLRSEPRFDDRPQQGDQAAGGDPVRDPGVERAIVFDASHQVHAGDAGAGEGPAGVLSSDELEQHVGRQVAADRDHAMSQLADAHRLTG